VLPLHIADHRKPFDAGGMFDVELDFLPHRGRFPAVETGHVEQHAQFSALPGKSFELRHELFVIRLGQNPADVNVEKIPAVAFIYVNGHFETFDAFQVQAIPPRKRFVKILDAPAGVASAWDLKIATTTFFPVIIFVLTCFRSSHGKYARSQTGCLLWGVHPTSRLTSLPYVPAEKHGSGPLSIPYERR
jgi:hypothetical protein